MYYFYQFKYTKCPLCVFLYERACVCVCVLYVAVSAQRLKADIRWFSCLSLNLELTIQRGWLASEPQGPPCVAVLHYRCVPGFHKEARDPNLGSLTEPSPQSHKRFF